MSSQVSVRTAGEGHAYARVEWQAARALVPIQGTPMPTMTPCPGLTVRIQAVAKIQED